MDRMLFAKHPELKEFVRNQPLKAPKEKEQEVTGPLTTAGKKSYLILGKQFNGVYDRMGSETNSAWFNHGNAEGQVLGNLEKPDYTTFASVGLQGHAIDHKKLRRGYRTDRQDCLVFNKIGGNRTKTGRDGGVKMGLV